MEISVSHLLLFFLFLRLVFSYQLLKLNFLVGAALSSISDVILSVDHWAKGRGDYVPPYSTRGCVRSFVSGLVPMAKRNHRLALCLTATYGRTLSKASEVLMQVRGSKSERGNDRTIESIEKDSVCV